ncbi:Mobile element protein [Streptococcus parasanguinis]|nr:hypothetical protein [Streptococcus parasanguinis]KXT89444.1 Mobile element protein [Streptococcus parasanguinis]
MRTPYRLADIGILDKMDLPWIGKRKPNGQKENSWKTSFSYKFREKADIYPDFKTEFDHLEGDTIAGEKVITLPECFSNAFIILKTNGQKASDFDASINQWLSKVPNHLFKSITFDCGKNFLIGNLFRMHTTLIFSLRIQDFLVKEVSMNILIAYGDGITETKGV